MSETSAHQSAARTPGAKRAAPAEYVFNLAVEDASHGLHGIKAA